MNRLPVSIFIIAKNEADRIARTIESVIGWVDEVIVIDSGSEDDTIEVAAALGARVEFNQWRGYGAQKIFGESLCRNDWILNLDADEAASAELVSEITALFPSLTTNSSIAAFSVDCALMLPGEENPRRYCVKTRAIRFYNKTKAGFRDSTVHDSVVVREGSLKHLKSLVYHRSFRGYAHETAKINSYTTMQAEDWIRRGKPAPTLLRVLTEPFTAFFKAYFIRRFILYGLDGFIQAWIYSFSKTIRLAKVREALMKSNIKNNINKALITLGLLFLASCAVKRPDHMELTRADFADIPGWRDDAVEAALPPFKESCGKLLAKSPEDNIGAAVEMGTVSHWASACQAAASNNYSGTNARRFFEYYFSPYAVTNNGEAKGLITGYYEIDVKASRVKTPEYSHPIYRKPSDLSLPYYSRAEINSGVLDGQGLEIAWAADPVEVFFMEIQGSGRLLFPDGTKQRIGFAAQNGHEYHPIGATPVDMGELEREHLNAPAIINWLRNNPAMAREVMESNPSYVFFEERTTPPVGAQGLPLTPQRSVAVDKNFIAYGVPIFLNSSIPETPSYPASKLTALLIAQDTGGAIKGPTRLDYFWGNGALAAEKAGYMKQAGNMYVLLPKTLEFKAIAGNEYGF